MIVNSKDNILNYILIRKGGDKLYYHKYISKTKLPFISSNERNLFLTRPFLSESKNSTRNYILERNSINKKDNDMKANSLFSKTQKIEDPIIDKIDNSIQNNSNKNTRNLGTSISFKNFLSKDIFLNKLKYKNNNQINKNLTNYNNNKTNSYTDGIDENINNFNTFSTPHRYFKNEIINNSIKSNEKITKEKIQKLNNKKKYDIMNIIFKDNKNFLIDDYLKSKQSSNNKKILSHNDNHRSSYINYTDYNKKKRGQPILINDITIKSLINNYEKKKNKLIKLTPFIIKDNYLRKKNSKSISGIKDYELKINIKKYFNNSIKFRNFGKMFNLKFSNI